MSNNLLEIGKFLKEERIKKGISVKELAERTGVTDRAIAYWEKGQKKPTLIYADKILKALGLQLVLGVEEVVDK